MSNDPFGPPVVLDARAAQHVEAAPGSVNLAWKQAAAALDLHERGAIFRMMFPAVGFFVVLFAALAKLETLATLSAAAIPIGSFVAAIVAAVGAWRFGEAIPEARGARVSVVLQGLTVVCDLSIVLRKLQSDGWESRDERAVSFALLALDMLLGLAAIYAMLWAFVRVGRSLARPEARKRAVACAVTVTLGVLAFFAIALGTTHEAGTKAGLAGLLFGVIAMVLYMRTVRVLVEQLEGRADGTLVRLSTY